MVGAAGLGGGEGIDLGGGAAGMEIGAAGMGNGAGAGEVLAWVLLSAGATGGA